MRPSNFWNLSFLAVAALLAGCGGTASNASPSTPAATPPATAGAPATAASAAATAGTFTQLPSGVQYQVLKPGSGPMAEPGQTVTVNYTGWLTNGTQFDSSLGKAPFRFQLGAGRVIAGWDQGVTGMQVGEMRKLVIPPNLGYGSRGAGGVIPPNATLIFEVELLAIQ